MKLKLIYDFVKKNKLLVLALLVAAMPILITLVGLPSGQSDFSDAKLLRSSWNDELFYYKQVECMVEDFIPQGFFGYNESSAKCLSFGAWSPVILLPFYVFGKLFGWDLSAPYYANLTYLCIALFLCTLLSKPNLKKTIVLMGTLLLMTVPLSRYILSCMPEISVLAPFLVFIGLVIGYNDSGKKKARFIAMLVIAFILTLMRPYFVMLYIWPFLMVNNRKFIDKIISCVTGLTSIIVYFIISKFLIAPYNGDVYQTGFLDVFANQGFGAGFVNLFRETFHMLYASLSVALQGLRDGNGVGIYFAAFFIVSFILLIDTVRLFIKNSDYRFVTLSMLVCNIGLFLAIILMYSLHDGFRHLLIFIVGSLLISICMPLRHGITEIFTEMVIMWLFLIKATDPVYFGVANDTQTIGIPMRNYVDFNNEFCQSMELEDGISWDNDVIIVFKDYPAGGDPATASLTTWQYGYTLPKGFALSYCTSDYVMDNFDSLKSKYILTSTGGSVEDRLSFSGAEFIYGNDCMALYRIK